MTTQHEENPEDWYIAAGGHGDYVNLGEMSRLADWLITIGDDDQVSYMIEKPWKFGYAYAQMRELDGDAGVV